MLKIVKKGNEKGFLNPIDSGVRFGTAGEPLRFVLEGEKVADINIDVIVQVDEKASKAEWELETSPEKVTITFKHPKKSERSGMSNPVGFSKDDRFVVGLMFWIETIGEAPSFRMSYEFYGDQLSSPEEGGEK